MTSNWWNIQLPVDGDITRDQMWGFLRRSESSLRNVPERCPVMSPDEKEILASITSRLRNLAADIEKGVLGQLAALRAPEDDEDHGSYPLRLEQLIRDYHGDINVYRRHGGNMVELGLAILNEYGIDTITLSELIKRYLHPNTKYGQAWTCPQCDEERSGYVGEEICKRCYGWGFILEKPELGEYDKSQKGRLALNRSETWTDEQEAAEQARLESEDDD